MKNHVTLLACICISACVSAGQSTRGFQAIDLPKAQSKLGEMPLLVRQFSSLCLDGASKAAQIVEDAKTAGWEPASKTLLKKQGLTRLEKKTLAIPGGGAPVEETQNLLIKSFEGESLVLEISQRLDRKQLTAETCAIYGKQSEYLENCASLGEIVNRAPDQNTQYKESEAHFIGWNASLEGKQAKDQRHQEQALPSLQHQSHYPYQHHQRFLIYHFHL